MTFKRFAIGANDIRVIPLDTTAPRIGIALLPALTAFAADLIPIALTILIINFSGCFKNIFKNIQLSSQRSDCFISCCCGRAILQCPLGQYTTPGIYCYTITQQSGTHKRGHYDQTVYYVKVSVTNGENGNLETVIAAHMDADMTDAKRDITFINYYEPIKKTSESTTETIPTTKRKLETKPGNKTSTKKSKNKVKTGDNSNATLFSILLLASGTGLRIIAISRYREKYHK